MAKQQSTPIPPRVKSIIGYRYGRWTVIGFSHTQGKASYWIARCDCGTVRTHQRSALVSGGTFSCGCMRGEQLAARNVRHGHTGTPEYNTWRGMLARCKNPNAENYARYGGRGITVCARWENFANFLADMGKRPEGRTLDRIDNTIGYVPGNCRWATIGEQRRNRRQH